MIVVNGETVELSELGLDDDDDICVDVSVRFKVMAVVGTDDAVLLKLLDGSVAVVSNLVLTVEIL